MRDLCDPDNFGIDRVIKRLLGFGLIETIWPRPRL